MSEYTPTTGAVRAAYVDGASGEPVWFARWLEQVRAAARREGLAQGWDEAYEQGIWDERTSEDNIGIAGLGGKVGPCRSNPYRNGAGQ